MSARALVATALGLLAMATPAHADAHARKDLRAARAATKAYRVTHPARYGLLKDAAGIACIDKAGEGGMGIHYVDGDLVGDGKVRATRPEALVYEPRRDGREVLVALEYIVPQASWDASHAKAPRLFGRTFELVPAGNRYGLDPFYELHAWAWKHNPSGMFADWNPRVHCPGS